MKTGPDALGIVEIEFGGIKHVNVTRRPRYHPKRVRVRKNLKMGPDDLEIAENEFESAKHENETRRFCLKHQKLTRCTQFCPKRDVENKI
jgi:hypothetical protein